MFPLNPNKRRFPRVALLLGTIAPCLIVLASPALAASIGVTAINRSQCQTKTGGNSAFGSAVAYTSCRGDAGFGNGVMYNDVVAGVGGAGQQATLAIDGALFADAAGVGKRIHLRQLMRFDLSLDIQVDPGQDWEVHFDHGAQGLYAILEEVSSPSNNAILVAGGTIDVFLSGVGNYDVTVAPASQGGAVTTSTPFAGLRNDLFSGSGPTTITGQVSATFETLSQCAPGGGACGEGDEAALLYGLDDIGTTLPVTADDYATWNRAVEPDGYDATFTLVLVPEPASALLLGLGLVALRSVARRRP